MKDFEIVSEMEQVAKPNKSHFRRIIFISVTSMLLILIFEMIFVHLPPIPPGFGYTFRDNFYLLASEAYQYRTRAVSEGGGGGSYIGYNSGQDSLSSSNIRFGDIYGPYYIKSIDKNILVFKGVEKYDSLSAEATVDHKGHIISLVYYDNYGKRIE